MRAGRWLFLCGVLSGLGLALCAYLAVLHLAFLRGQLLWGVGCGAAQSLFNCHAVIASRWGQALGVPLAFWGLIGYVAAAALALIAWQFPEWRTMALTSLVGFGLAWLVVDAGLATIMLTQIRRLCPICLLTYLVNLALVLAAREAVGQPWASIIRHLPSALRVWWWPRTAVAWVFWGITLTGALGFLAAHATAQFLTQGPPGALRARVTEYVQQHPPVAVLGREGPTRGAPGAPIRVVVFSDFLCPICQQAATVDPILLAGHRHDVAFVFKSFPLDRECNPSIPQTVHPGACQLAALAACADAQGRFWAFHDDVMARASRGPITVGDEDLRRLGMDREAFQACAASGRGMAVVQRDVAEGARLNVTSTPTYFLNGVPITGVIAPAAFEEFLRALRETPSPAPSSNAS